MQQFTRKAVATLLAASCTGCASIESHLHDTRHPWHAYPAIGTELAVVAPFMPLAFAENALTGRELGTCGGNVSFVIGAATGLVAGTVVGGALWVAGSPLELVFPLPDEPTKSPDDATPEVRVPAPPPAPEIRGP